MILTKFIFDDYNYNDRDFLKEEFTIKLPFGHRIIKGDRVDGFLTKLDAEKIEKVNAYYRKLDNRESGSYVLRAIDIELDIDDKTKKPYILVICGFR